MVAALATNAAAELRVWDGFEQDCYAEDSRWLPQISVSYILNVSQSERDAFLRRT